MVYGGNLCVMSWEDLFCMNPRYGLYYRELVFNGFRLGVRSGSSGDGCCKNLPPIQNDDPEQRRSVSPDDKTLLFRIH